MIENDDAAAQAAAQAAISNEQVQAIDMFTAPELEPSRLRLLPSRGSSSGGTSAVPSPKPSQTTCHLGFSVPPMCQPQSFHLALHLHRCASNSNCSSSCSNACPRLNMKASWVRSSTPSFRCTFYPSFYLSIHLSICSCLSPLSTRHCTHHYLENTQGCPFPRACGRRWIRFAPERSLACCSIWTRTRPYPSTCTRS